MKNRALKYTISFGIISVIISLLVFYVQHNSISTYERNLPYIRLSDNVKNRITLGHLWFEEAIAGDKSITVETAVLDRFTSSKIILQAAYDGADSEIGHFEKLEDEDAQVILKQSIFAVEKLITVATKRWENHKSNLAPAAPVVVPDSLTQTGDSTAVLAPTTPVAASDQAGSELDQEFDAAFEQVVDLLDRLHGYFNKVVQDDSSYLNSMSIISLTLIVAVFAVLCFLLYRLQHGNDKLAFDAETRMNEQTEASAKLSDFIEAVSSGNFSVDLALQGDEGLSTKLIAMRDKLGENAEDERKRGWSTMGLAQIGELLRSTMNSSELFDKIVQFLVKYTKSNQGGLFVLQEDDDGRESYLELMASYAFERKKFLTKKLASGEGLVGQCFLEGERIYLKEVPDAYVSITSGLGGARPKALLLVPMKLNDRVYGVIELASFNAYKDYEIELVEKLAETIASTISTVRVNESTRILLEKTQQQAEEMKAQEEEIRQNMEELEATQEEMRRKQSVLERELTQSKETADTLHAKERRLAESQETLQAIVDNIPVAVFWKDRDLRFLGCNKIFASVAGVSSIGDVVGKTDFDMAWFAQADAYRKDDQEVMNSKQARLGIEEVNVNSSGEETWVRTSKVPIMNEEGNVIAILGMFEDITDRKRHDADVAGKLKERDEALLEIARLKQQLGL